MKKIKGHRNFTGSAAEYFVAAEIEQRNGIATITPNNSAKIDILASNPEGSKEVVIQVKGGRMETGGFIISKSRLTRYKNNFFFVFVLLKKNHSQPDYWIVPGNLVRKLAEADHRKGSLQVPRKLAWRYLQSGKLSGYRDKWEILNLWN